MSPSPAAAASFNLLGITLEEDEPLVMDEFACLNLNITTPLEQQDQLLPVAVFIHGCDYYPYYPYYPQTSAVLCFSFNIYACPDRCIIRGANCFGCGSAPGLNGAAFVHQSMRLGMPVIFVTVK